MQWLYGHERRDATRCGEEDLAAADTGVCVCSTPQRKASEDKTLEEYWPAPSVTNIITVIVMIMLYIAANIATGEVFTLMLSIFPIQQCSGLLDLGEQ